MDTLSPSPDQMGVVTVAVLLPSRKYCSGHLKYTSTVPLHYLPYWSLEELKRVTHVYSKASKKVEDWFGMIGELLDTC